MYEQTLYKVVEDYIKPHAMAKMNKAKKWEYGYNEDYDLVVISKTGSDRDWETKFKNCFT